MIVLTQQRGLCASLFLCLSLTLSGGLSAQTVRNAPIEMHPIQAQVGVITRTLSDAVWIKMPGMVKEGAKVEFMMFSDGSDVVATGQVRWVTPIAPYEAYVTNLKAKTTSHQIHIYDDLLSTGEFFHPKVSLGVSAERDPFAAPLSVGFFARASREAASVASDNTEPVRAHLSALRARRTKIAEAIAAAGEKALTPDSIRPDDSEDEPVNYAMLYDHLKRFQKRVIEDPITSKLLSRLMSLVADKGSINEAVATDFLRPTNTQNNGQYGNSGTAPRR